VGLTSDFAIAMLVIVGSLSALSYLLFCDALRLKYCRSVGKILFGLRPVSDVADDRGAIGLGASAKRNLPFIVALMFSPLLLIPPYLLTYALLAMLFFVAGMLFPEQVGNLITGIGDGMSPGVAIFAMLMWSLVMLWVFYSFENIRKVGNRWFGVRWSKWLVRPLLAVLFPPSWFIFEGDRTVGDRWSRTQVIDADSEESLRIDAPPRYVRPEPDQVEVAPAPG